MNHLPLSVLLFALCLLASACNFGPDTPSWDDDDDSSTGDDDDTTSSGPVEATIAELTSGNLAPETWVTVSGGVVSTPVWTDDDLEETDAFFWIQDGSGPGSGIVVYTFRDVVESLEGQIPPGTAVTITGSYIVPFEFPELRLTSAQDLLVTGSEDIPTATPLSGSDIANGVAADPLLIGTLVSLQGALVTSGPSYESFYEWEAGGAIVDDYFYYADVQDNYLLTNLAGVLHLSYGDAKLFPRWAEDVLYTYPGCDVAWTGSDNLQSLNCRTLAENSPASASGLVVVSGETRFAGAAFYAVDPNVTAFGGILVYSNEDDTPVPAIGSIIDVNNATYVDYRGNTELKIDAAADITTTGTHPDPASLAVPVLDACTITEAHEGMLVSIASVTVIAQDSNASSWGYYKVSGCPEVHVGSDLFTNSETFNNASGGAGTVTELSGVVSAYYNVWTINPRDALDWITWAGN